MSATPLIEEPLFITEEIEAEMIKAGYVFEPPSMCAFEQRLRLSRAVGFPFQLTTVLLRRQSSGLVGYKKLT